MKTKRSMLLVALATAGVLSAAPLVSAARPGSGGGGGPGYNHVGGYHGGYHGGGYYGYRGGWYGGWGYRGWGPRYYGYGWPGYAWGPYWGVGLGVAAVAYSAPYHHYYGGYYGYPAGYVAPVSEYVVSEPTSGDRVVRSGRPVPAAPAPDPIFYPRNGQTAEQTEADRQDCNRWATTQAGALSDAHIFQRATYACMDGRGYSVR